MKDTGWGVYRSQQHIHDILDILITGQIATSHFAQIYGTDGPLFTSGWVPD